MTRKTYILSGTIKTISPLTFTPPLSTNPRRNNGGIIKSEHTLPTLGGALFFPATGIRGKLRRMALEVARTALSEQEGEEHCFKLDDYFLGSLGGIKQGKGKGKSEDAEGLTGEEEKAKQVEATLDVRKLRYVRDNNPLISLFGAMDPLGVEGKAQIGFAVCDPGIKADIIRHVRSNELTRNSAVWDVLDDNAYDELVGITIEGRQKTESKAAIKALSAQIKKAGESEKAELMAEKSRIEQQVKDEGTVNISHPGLNYEVIPPNTDMTFRISLQKVSEQEVSLFLRALGAFGFNPMLGSHVAHGCGLVAMHLDMSVQDQFSLKKIGSLDIDGDYSGIKMSPDVAALIVPLDLDAEAFSSDYLRKL